MRKKKILLALALLVLASCGKASSDSSLTPTLEPQTPYSVEQKEGEKAHFIDRNGHALLASSSLVRTDLLVNADFLSPSAMEDYFALAKETGNPFLDIPFMWKQIETAKDVYNEDAIRTYLDFAKKYSIRLNLLWYGSFVDGETHTANLPSYVVKDETSYPVIKKMFAFANYGMCQIQKWDAPALLEREQKALYNLMNAVASWNKENDYYDPVLMVQLGQGLDRFQRWRVDAYKVPGKDGSLMSSDEAWGMVDTYIQALAKGVKSSSYHALTRSEFDEQSAVTNYVRAIQKIEGVDLVCPTYLHTISSQKSGIKAFTDEYPSMPVVNAENWASDINYRQLLVAFQMGGDGFTSYDLSPARYYPERPTGKLFDRYNPSGTSITEKFPEVGTRAQDSKKAFVALQKAYPAVASSPRSSFALLGFDNLLSGEQKIYFNNGLLLNYSNPTGSYGYVVYYQNAIYAYSSFASSLTLEGVTLSSASHGAFNREGVWEMEGADTLSGNKTLSLMGGTVYRLKSLGLSPLPGQTELDSAGYKSILDSVRG
jgi:hypothetical protein